MTLGFGGGGSGGVIQLQLNNKLLIMMFILGLGARCIHPDEARLGLQGSGRADHRGGPVRREPGNRGVLEHSGRAGQLPVYAELSHVSFAQP